MKNVMKKIKEAIEESDNFGYAREYAQELDNCLWALEQGRGIDFFKSELRGLMEEWGGGSTARTDAINWVIELMQEQENK